MSAPAAVAIVTKTVTTITTTAAIERENREEKAEDYPYTSRLGERTAFSLQLKEKGAEFEG